LQRFFSSTFTQNWHCLFINDKDQYFRDSELWWIWY